MKLPILTRYKGADGKWSAAMIANTPKQARRYLEAYRRNGYTEFFIGDADGQSFTERELKAASKGR